MFKITLNRELSTKLMQKKLFTFNCSWVTV